MTSPPAEQCLWDKLPTDIEHRIYAHVLATLLSKPNPLKFTLLRTDHCLVAPPVLFGALRDLAAYLASPYNRPGEDEECEWYPSCRYRLFRLDHHHNVWAEEILRLPQPANGDRFRKPETRLWLLEALDLAEDREFFSNASLRSLEFFGASPRDLRRRGGAREALRQQEEWDRVEERDRFEDDVPPAHRVRCKKLEYARERDWR